MAEAVLSAERGEALHAHSAEEALGWVGHKLDDLGGTPVGRVEEILVEPESNSPSWLLVKVGRIGGRRTAVPFDYAAAGVGRVWVPYPRDTIRSAPAVSRGKGLEPALEDELRRHYAIAAGGNGEAEPAGDADTPGGDED